jgi:hypothetical protein
VKNCFSFCLAILRQLAKNAHELISNQRFKRALSDSPSYYAKYVDYNWRLNVELVLVLDTLMVSVLISAFVAIVTYTTIFLIKPGVNCSVSTFHSDSPMLPHYGIFLVQRIHSDSAQRSGGTRGCIISFEKINFTSRQN